MVNKDVWKKLMDKAETITDGLGKKIDEGIKEVVVSLWLAGFETSGSCEGHLNWGLKAPWVDLGKHPTETDLVGLKKKSMPISEVFIKFPNLKKLRNQNLRMQLRLLELMTEFYTNRDVPEDESLVPSQFGIYGAVRLVNQGVEVQEIRTKKEQRLKLKKYQKEMSDFGIFLKKKFFTS